MYSCNISSFNVLVWDPERGVREKHQVSGLKEEAPPVAAKQARIRKEVTYVRCLLVLVL